MPLLVEAEREEAFFADLLPALLAEQRAQAPEAAGTPRTILAWAERHRRIDDRPFSLDRFAPLRALYEDDHPHICVMKPAQRGVSEWAINLSGFALEHGAVTWAPEKDGLNVAYVFPTVDSLRDFSKERFSGLRDESPHLRALFAGAGEFDGVTFKQVGRSYLYLRGGWSTSALRSFAADVLILDEYDELDPEAVALARRRLNASVVRREVDISTPTLPNEGIHRLYQQSDQRVYEQPCSGCGSWHVWEVERDVRADGVAYDEWRRWPPERLRRATIALVCPTCGQRLSDAERCAEGRWVAQAPDVTGLRGYALPALAWPFVRLIDLAVAAVSDDAHERQEFRRSDLGMPYVDTELTVFRAEWWANGRNRYDALDPRHTNACVGRYLSFDTAYKDQEQHDATSYGVYELWCDYRLAVREVWWEKINSVDLPERIADTAAQYNTDGKLMAVLIEDKGSGIGALQELQSLRSTSPAWLRPLLKPYLPQQSKEYRARQASRWCARDCILLPHPSEAAPWLLAFEQMLYRFPNTPLKDPIDQFSQMILWLNSVDSTNGYNMIEQGWRAREMARERAVQAAAEWEAA